MGGVNPFSMTAEDFGITSDFVGAIRNVIIGDSQVNLRCPQEEENTLTGKKQKLNLT